MSSAGQRRLQELDQRWSFWQNKSDCGNEQQHQRQLWKEAKVKGMGNTAHTHSIEGLQPRGRKEGTLMLLVSLAGARPKEDMKPSLSFNNRINTGFKLGFIILFSGYSYRTLEDEAAFRRTVSVAAVGKRYKRGERSLEAAERQRCLANKGGARGREPRSLRMWRRTLFLTSICWLWKHFIGCSHHGNIWSPSHNFGPYVLCQSLLTALISEPKSIEKLQKVAAVGQIVCHVICKCHFQFVKCLGRYFHKINLYANTHKKKFSLECHVPLELLSSWSNPNISLPGHLSWAFSKTQNN